MNQHEDKSTEITAQTSRKKLFLSVLAACLLGGAIVLGVTLELSLVLGLAGSWIPGFGMYGVLLLGSAGFLRHHFPFAMEPVPDEENPLRSS